MSSVNRRTAAATLVVMMVLAVAAEATPRIQGLFRAKYPKTQGSRLGKCNTCHTMKPPVLNPYGMDLKAAHSKFDAIEAKDSDKDGAINIIEIKALTFPGDPKDKPGSALADSTRKPPRDSTGVDTTVKATPDTIAAPDSILKIPHER